MKLLGRSRPRFLAAGATGAVLAAAIWHLAVGGPIPWRHRGGEGEPAGGGAVADGYYSLMFWLALLAWWFLGGGKSLAGIARARFRRGGNP